MLGGAVEAGEEEDELLSEPLNHNGVYKTAPGFAQICYIAQSSLPLFANLNFSEFITYLAVC